MKIDRDRFLLLAAALAAPSCGRAAATISADTPLLPPVASAVVDPDASPITAPPPPPPGAVVSSQPVAASASPPDATACEKENDTGTVDCSKLKGRRLGGPSCEGLDGTCDLLAKGSAYRPKAAAAAAACMTRLGAGACDIRARNRCYLEGVRASCAEPQYESRCQAKIDMCRAAGIRVQYTKEECMKAMSAQQERDREWAISQMGPSSEGKCQLMYTVF